MNFKNDTWISAKSAPAPQSGTNFFDLTYWLPTTTSPLLLATTTTTTVTTTTTTTFTTTTTSAVARAIPARLRTSWYVLNLNTKLPPFPPWMFWSKPKKNVSINNKKIITHILFEGSNIWLSQFFYAFESQISRVYTIFSIITCRRQMAWWENAEETNLFFVEKTRILTNG